MNLPFIPQYAPDFDQADALAVNEYMLGGGWVTEFEKTEEFESCIRKVTGAEFAVALPSGTLGLVASLQALGVRAGDEVIVPNLTMAATANAALMIGAVPVFADIEPDQLSLCPKAVERAITSKTKAVIHVSLNGRAGSIKMVKVICDQRKIALLEDAAQSLGSTFEGIHLGRIGICGVFSFSSPKIISTGQGGAAITDDRKIAEKLRYLKNFGRKSGGDDIYTHVGFNYKFTDLQATLGISQLKKLPQRKLIKKKLFSEYKNRLSESSQVKMIDTDLESVTPWFIDILAPRRTELQAFLKARGIGTRPIYPALHAQQAYQKSGNHPHSTRIAEEGLWLPSSFNLGMSEIDRICAEIQTFYSEYPL